MTDMAIKPREGWDEGAFHVLQRLEQVIHDHVHREDEQYTELRDQQKDHGERIARNEQRLNEVHGKLDQLNSNQNELMEWLRPHKIVADFFGLMERVTTRLLKSTLVRIATAVILSLSLLSQGNWQGALDALKAAIGLK